MLIGGLSQVFSMSKCRVVWSFCFFQGGESGLFCLFCFLGWLVLCLFLYGAFLTIACNTDSKTEAHGKVGAYRSQLFLKLFLSDFLQLF